LREREGKLVGALSMDDVIVEEIDGARGPEDLPPTMGHAIRRACSEGENNAVITPERKRKNMLRTCGICLPRTREAQSLIESFE